MLLAIDIGNTNITLVFLKVRSFGLPGIWLRMSTAWLMSMPLYCLICCTSKVWTSPDIKAIALCSVVPPLISTFDELFQRYFHLSPLVVGAGVKTGVRIRMDNPREVGADRIVNAAAAHHLYGGPVIVIDLGTATTFDTVSKEGDYHGWGYCPRYSHCG